jgi:hypothetical protein
MQKVQRLGKSISAFHWNIAGITDDVLSYSISKLALQEVQLGWNVIHTNLTKTTTA